MDLKQQKELLRKRIKERAAHLKPEERAAESRSICRRIVESLPKDGPLVIAAFLPMPSEPNIRSVLETLLEKKIPLYIPCFQQNSCVFRRLDDLEDAVMGPLKVLEAPRSADELDLTTLTHALLPGTAFGTDGTRLGRGNGGYDIWLRKLREANPAAKAWAVAFEHQVGRTVPMEAHDEYIDAIITPRSFISSPPRSSQSA